MGWSCAGKAGIRLRAIQEWVFAKGGCDSQNLWQDPATGTRHFFEVGRENRDGAITGSIYRMTTDSQCVKSGSFRIEPDGWMTRGPALLKAVPAYELFIDGYSHADWDYSEGEPTEEKLLEYLIIHVHSFYPGGVNEGSAKTIPYPNKAKIVRLNDGKTVVEWKAPMFFVWPEPAKTEA